MGPIAESEVPNSEPEADSGPSPAEVLLPPFFMMLVLIIGIAYLALKSRACWWEPRLRRALSRCKGRCARVRDIEILPRLGITHHSQSDCQLQQIGHKTASNGINPNPPLFSDFDREVISNMKTFYNRPKELLRISLPALISLAFCPVVLFLYQPGVTFFWPDQPMPDVNEAMYSFLMPSGLVYATVFGFALMTALRKNLDNYLNMSKEIGMVDLMATLSLKLNLPSANIRLGLLRAIKAEMIRMMMNVQNRDVTDYKHTTGESITVELWSVVDIVRESNKARNFYKSMVDHTLWETMMRQLVSLNSISSVPMQTFHSRIHPAKWLFMELLGFFAFFGISLLKVDSYRLELTMCFMTAFSISAQCYVISDLDSPFSGFFRVDMTTLSEVAEHIELMYNNTIKGDFDIPQYPPKRKRYK